MSNLRVGTGWGKLTFEAALTRSKDGDTITLDPGRYEIERCMIPRGVTIRGTAGPSDTVLEGRITPAGFASLSKLTLASPSFDNAVKLDAVHAGHLELTDCVVIGDRAGKYPAVWGENSTVVLNRVRIECTPDGRGLNLDKGSTLHATRSSLETVAIYSSRADLIDVTAETIIAESRSRLKTFGTLTSTPRPGKRVLYAAGQTECVLAHVACAEEDPEIGCDDSLLEIGSTGLPDGVRLRVMADEGSKVRTEDPRVDVRQAGVEPAPAAAPEPAAPKFVHWPIEHARAFAEKIAPQLNPGDTILVDEGDYYVEDQNGLLFLNGNLTGQGRADRVVIHGTVGAMVDADVTVANVTIRPPASANAFNQTSNGASATLRNVILDADPEATVPAIYANTGSLDLDECTVSAGDDAQVGIVELGGSARLTARRSELGWLGTRDRARVTLSTSYSYQLFAVEDSTITVEDTHFLRGSTANLFEIGALDRSAVTIPQLVSSAPETRARVADGSLTIGEFRSTADGSLRVDRSGEVSIEISNASYDLYDVDSDGEISFVETVGAATAHAEEQTAEPVGEPVDAHDAESLRTVETDEASTARDGRPKRDAALDPLAELNAMTGLAAVKAKAQSFVNQVKFNQKRAELGFANGSAFTLHSMFLGSPGTGKTTVARILGEALHQAGVVSSDAFIEADRSMLVSSNIGGTAEKTMKVLKSALGGVLFIDEAYALAQEGNQHFSQEAVDTILAFMENHRDDMMVIFAGYSDKMYEFLEMNEGLKSRIPNEFVFEDYSPAEIAGIGLAELHTNDFSVNEELYRRVIANAYAQSSDNSNARWARNFNQTLMEQVIGRVSALPDPSAEDLTTILDEDLHALSGGDATARAGQVEELLAELDGMIGLQPVKDWVRSLVDQATVNQRMMEHDGSMERPSYHMTFTGNAGTGKTTVARIVAQLFHALGVLGKGTVKEVDRARLIGQYFGESEKNTTRVLDEAMGGVLFIDEAYQLYVEESPRDPGRQIIDTLLPRLENDRDKFVAIFAGYSSDMERFYKSNQGLQSRVPLEIEFPDYSSAEVAEIASLVLGDKWSFNEDLMREVTIAAYDALPAKDRSNGRWARNFVERIGARHMSHLVEHDVHGEAMRTIDDEVLRSFLPAD